MTYSQVFNIINDELRLLSDDADFNLDHIEFLCSKWRAYILETENLNKAIISELTFDSPLYQRICVSLSEVPPAGTSYCCDGGTVLKSNMPIPELLHKHAKVDLLNFFKSAHIIYMPDADRFKYIGHNKWTKDLLYASILPDGHLYIKSYSTPSYKELNTVCLTAIFQGIDKVRDLLCTKDGTPCNYLNSTYPLAEYQLPALIQYVVQELSSRIYAPKDSVNNSNDDLHKIGMVNNDNNNQETKKE